MAKKVVFGLIAGFMLACVWHLALASGDKKVAVLELVNKAGVTDDEAYALTDRVRMIASENLPGAHFTIMTSENIQELLPPDMDLKKCTTAECEVEMGRMIGAEYLITGEIIRFAGDLRINLKVHNSRTGHFVGGRSCEATDIRSLETALKGISKQIFGLVLSHAGVAAPARGGGAAVFVSPTQPSSTGGAAEVRALAPSEQPPATATGPAGLYITSNPPGADVYLGQTKAGTTSPAFQKVNLKPGTTVRVTLKMDLYHDVSFDVALKPGVMKFEGVELKPAFGSLKIESEPSGAKVLIGGTEVGTTPYNNPRYPSGNYLVVVKMDLFHDQSFQLNVGSGTSHSENLSLKPEFGSLKIDSEPSGAKVLIGGSEVGTTPYTNLRYPSGQYLLSLELDWHLPVLDEVFTVINGETTLRSFKLSQDFGTLDVASNPSGAKVLLNGKKLGITPGNFRLAPVKAGKLKVVMAGYRSKKFKISLDRGQTVKITADQATLQAKLGSLQVYADPPVPGAKVFVDGQVIGAAPLTVTGLIEGNHEVKVESKDKTGTMTISVAEGQTAVATIKLKSKGVLGAGGKIWTDVSTGLMWQVVPTRGKKNKTSKNLTKSHCRRLTLAGYGDWRLPTISELRSLIRGCPATEKGGSCSVTDLRLNRNWLEKSCWGCSSRKGPGRDGMYMPPELSGNCCSYWSSSAVTGENRSTWFVNFRTGRIYNDYSGGNAKFNSITRCVR
ncbi:MAG: PEGA domain-containing protein [Candidatus Lernaella stagnicola]|nr:PEGA domain-containing protein [Candidatus Lernaella stagnicola]